MADGRHELDTRPAADGIPADGARMVRLEQFECPHGLAGAELAACRRRFMPLFVDDEHARRGGLGVVARAENAYGEVFAVKTLIEPDREDGETDESYAARVEASHAAFRQEYESHRAVSGIKGFPRLYAFGRIEGAPALVMEWIAGLTLAQARESLAVDDEGRLSPLVAARLGRDIFELLDRLSIVGEGFVHRDLSQANIMLRTAGLSVEDQAAEGAFDVRLIDFGSSVALECPRESAFTSRYAALRRATTAYAPPEMLSDDIAGVMTLRASSSIDVYAAASVLFELLCGTPPFDMEAAASERTPYRVKVDSEVRPFVAAHARGRDIPAVLVREPEVALVAGNASVPRGIGPDAPEFQEALDRVDAQLADIILPCLSARQENRPTARGVYEALSAFCANYAVNIERSLDNVRLLPCTDRRSWFEGLSPYSVWRLACAAGKALCYAILFFVVALTSILLDGVIAAVQVGPARVLVQIGGVSAALLLALPAILGAAARHRPAAARTCFVRGSLGVVAGGLIALAFSVAVWPYALSERWVLPVAVFAAAAASWGPVVLEYAVTAAPALVAEIRRALPGPTSANRLLDGARLEWRRLGPASSKEDPRDAE